MHMVPIDKDPVRAELTCLFHRHRRADAELARFIRGCCHDTARTRTADDDGLSAKRRVVTLFDRRIERIHIDVHDKSHPILLLSS